MTSQWTSKYAIMRDLSLAQGSDVPAALDTTVGVGEKPPALDITEETEEEYYGHCTVDPDLPVTPDLGLIQQMLEMVRSSDISSDHEEEPDKVLQISKPPCENGIKITIDTLPTIIGKNVTNTKSINNKVQSVPMRKSKGKRENVAVNSILEAMAGDTPILNMEKPTSEPLKLLKPTDFFSTDKEVVESVEKVNGWLNSQHNLKCLKPSSRHLNWEPSLMFKRKNGSTVKSPESGSGTSLPAQKLGTAATASYQPSTLANAYYQKYVERSRLAEYVKEDVWTRAERIMKEKDAKKRAEAEAIEELAAIEVANESSSTLDSSGEIGSERSPEAIQLPQHRHLLTGDCLVCQVVKGRGFDVHPDQSK